MDIVISVVISLRPGFRISAEAIIKNTRRIIATPPSYLKGMHREKVNGERRRPRNEELNDLHSQNIIRVISKKMRWAGHIEFMGEMRVSNSEKT